MSEGAGREVAPSWGSRLDGIDGLRGVAALSVMFGHTIIVLMLPTFTGAAQVGPLTGFLLNGLTLFFVLSGFLLYRPFAVAIIERAALPSTRHFLRNRVLRIWPAYVAILILAGVVAGAAVLEHTGPLADWDIGRLTDPGLLLANVFLVQGWFPSGLYTGLSVSWSLIPEVTFYLLLPLLGALGAYVARRRSAFVAAMVPALVLFAVGLAGRLIAELTTDTAANTQPGRAHTWSDVATASFLTKGDLFAMGMIAAVVVVCLDRLGDLGMARLRRASWAIVWLGVVGVLAIGDAEKAAPAIGLFSAASIVLLSIPLRGRVVGVAMALLESRALRSVGVWSYSVYLWHFSVLLFLREHVDRSMYDSATGLLLSIVLVTAVTCTLAYVTYRFVEAPAMRRKRRIGSPAHT